MSGRLRHGLNVVQENPAPLDEPILPLLTSVHRPLSPGLVRQSAVLGIAGSLHADTAGRLQMFLPMFTVDGGPREPEPDAVPEAPVGDNDGPRLEGV